VSLTDSEVALIAEETRLRHRVATLEHELRMARMKLQEMETRIRSPKVRQSLLPRVETKEYGLRPDQISDNLISSLESLKQSTGPRCKFCGFAVDEIGGADLLFGVCGICRGVHGPQDSRPRALLEAVLEEPHQPMLIEFAAADAWSQSLGRQLASESALTLSPI
jgi:hypothetical protein